MARRRGRAYRRRGYTSIAFLLVSLLLLAVALIAHPAYRLSSKRIDTCLVPDTVLDLVLDELNDSLGAKNLVILYTSCNGASCSSPGSSAVSINSLLRSKHLSISIGSSLLDNILIEIETGETLPPSRITSTGEHGSSLLFAWSYPSLKAVLYVSLESRKALLSVKGEPLDHYEPPRGCTTSKASGVGGASGETYVLQCDRNIYASRLVFTQHKGIVYSKQLAIKDYYCPGEGVVEEYLDTSAILALAAALLLVAALAKLVRGHS